jgi:hypothetical protein
MITAVTLRRAVAVTFLLASISPRGAPDCEAVGQIMKP